MNQQLRPPTFEPRRRRWPGIAALAVLGLALAAVVVASWTDVGSLLHLSRAQDGLWLFEDDISAVFVAAS